MKPSLATLLLLISSSHFATATPGNGTLTLTAPTSTENKLSVTISGQAGGLTATDTKTTNVAGDMNVAMDIDPSAGGTSRFTISNGNISLTNMNFTLKALGFITVATINTNGMNGSAFTPLPPGLATPTGSGGSFDASQHRIRINQGTITGTLTIPGQAATPINVNFADSPLEGAGTGTGTLTVVLGSTIGSQRNCAVTMLLPVDFTQNQDIDGTPVAIRVKGTIKAAGAVPVRLATSVTQIWNANATGSPTDGTGNWNTTATNWWDGTINQAWSNEYKDTAQFGFGSGHTSPYIVTLGAPITAGGLTFKDQAYTITGNTITMVGSPTISTIAPSATIGSKVTGGTNSDTLTKNGPGALTLTNTTNDYAGNMMVGEGTLSLKTGRLYGGTVGGGNRTVTIANGAVLEVGRWGDGNTSTGLGTVGFAPENLVVNGSTIRFAASIDSGNFDRNLTIGSGGATLEAAGTTQWNLLAGNYGTALGNVGNQPLTLSGSKNGKLGFSMNLGSGNLTKSGNGTWTLGSANPDHQGNIVVIGGKLVGLAKGSFGNTTNGRIITVGTGAILDFAESDVMGDHSIAGAPVIVNGGTITNSDPAATGKINNGLGNLTLNNGTLTATTGNGISTIDLNRPNEGYGAWGFNGTVTSSGTSDINVGSLTGVGGRILLNSSAANTVFNVTDGTLTVSATLQGGDNDAAGLTKAGAGKLVLSGTSIYQAPTVVENGILELTGSLMKADGVGMNPSNVTVGENGTLSGTGTAGGTLTVGGVVSPGIGIGTLTVGATTFAASGSLAVEINSNMGTSDRLAVVGGLNLNATSTLAISDLGSTKLVGTKLVLITYTGLWNNVAFAGAPDGGQVVVGSNTFHIDYNDTVDGVSAVTLTEGPVDPYNSWVASYSLTGENAAKTADADGDGFNNLLEFATNSNPTQGGSGPRTYSIMHLIDGNNALTYTVAVRKGASFAAAAHPNEKMQTATRDQVNYTIEASSDLAVWNAVEITEIIGPEAAAVQAALGNQLTTPALGVDWEWHSFRTAGGAAVNPSIFMRLKVHVAP